MSIVDTPSEGSDFLQMAAFLSNPDKLAAEYKRLKDAQDAAQAVIDLAGPATEILNLRAKALQDGDVARETMEAAKASAVKIVDDAKSTAESIVETARIVAEDRATEATGTVAAAQSMRDKAAQIMQDAVSKQAEVDAAAEGVAQAVKEAQAAKDEMNAATDRLNALRSKLEGAAQDIAGALSDSHT